MEKAQEWLHTPRVVHRVKLLAICVSKWYKYIMSDPIRTYDCFMDSVVEGDLSLFPMPQRLAQEAVICDQRLATVAMGERDASILLRYASGVTEPLRLHVVKLALLTATFDVTRSVFDRETAHCFLAGASPYLGDRAIVGALGDMSTEETPTTVPLIQDAVWALVE